MFCCFPLETKLDVCVCVAGWWCWRAGLQTTLQPTATSTSWQAMKTATETHTNTHSHAHKHSINSLPLMQTRESATGGDTHLTANPPETSCVTGRRSWGADVDSQLF